MSEPKKIYTVDDIQVLSGAVAIRKRPRMYFQRLEDEDIFDRLAIDGLCHALDEVIDGNCSEIKIIINESSFQVNYNASMSLDVKHGRTIAEEIMTTLFACKHSKKHEEIGDKYCRVSMAALNAGSSLCRLRTVCTGKVGSIHFAKGEVVQEMSIKTTQDADSTELFFEPDVSIFGVKSFHFEAIQKTISEMRVDFPSLNVSVQQSAT